MLFFDSPSLILLQIVKLRCREWFKSAAIKGCLNVVQQTFRHIFARLIDHVLHRKIKELETSIIACSQLRFRCAFCVCVCCMLCLTIESFSYFGFEIIL